MLKIIYVIIRNENMFGKKKKTEKKETSSKKTVTKNSSAKITAAKKTASTSTNTTVKITPGALPETSYIANDAHYDQVIERIKDVKKTLFYFFAIQI